MISILIYIALIIYGLYLYRCNDPWAIKFTSLMGLALIVAIWESVSANYLDLSVGVRKMETILISSIRLVLIIVLFSFATKELAPYLKNRFRKKRND